MYTLKRIIANLLLIIMVLSVGIGGNTPASYAITYATAVSKVEIVDSPEIYEGDEITVKVHLNGVAQKIKIMETTNFKSLDGEFYYAKDLGGDYTFTLRLVYLGGNNELKLKVTPMFDDSGTPFSPFETGILIKGVNRSTPAGVTLDAFKVAKTTLREVQAGMEIGLEVPIETTANMTGKKVIATITSPVDGTLFRTNESVTTTTVEGLGNRDTGIAKFRLFIQPTAKSKTHELKIKLSYINDSGVIYSDEVGNSYFIKVKNSNVEPTIGVVGYGLKGKVAVAGKTDELSLTLENTGTIEGTDIRVKLTGFDKDRIKLMNDTDVKSINSLDGKGKSTVRFNIAAAAAAKTETQELTAEITYIDLSGKDYKVTSRIFLPIEGKDVAAIELRVLNLKMPERIKSKTPFDIEFDVKNVSKIDANMVEIGVEYPNATFIPKSTPKKFIRTLKSGEQQHFKFSFISKEEAITGFYDLYTTLKYNIEGGKDTEAQNYKEFAGIYLEGALGLGRPKVIIQNYDFGGSNVLAGKEFTLDLELFNTSSEESIKNIKVSLKADDGIFNPVDMSSSFFMPMIGPQETTTKTIKLKTKPDATVKTYNLLVTFMYEDSKGNAYDAQKNPFKEEETIAIPVGQPIRLETSEVTYPPEVFANQPVTVSMEFFNMGKSPIYNLMVKASGDFQVQGSNYFVGNFEAGRSDYFETTIVPSKEGECIGKVEFVYEDANGEPGVYTKELKLNVMPMAPIVDPANPDGLNPDGSPIGNPDGTPPQPTAQGKLIIVGILVGIGTLIGATLIWKRRAERKVSARVEDEDE